MIDEVPTRKRFPKSSGAARLPPSNVPQGVFLFRECEAPAEPRERRSQAPRRGVPESSKPIQSSWNQETLHIAPRPLFASADRDERHMFGGLRADVDDSCSRQRSPARQRLGSSQSPGKTSDR